MAEEPAWKEDFPISWVDDGFVTRRKFTKSLVLVSFATFASNAVMAGLGLSSRKPEEESPLEQKIARTDELEVGGSKIFYFPSPDQPCLLVRTKPDEYVAYRQKCTHLGCPVHYQSACGAFYCPCHEGLFSGEDGRVLSGPAPRALPGVELERRDDELWAIRMKA